MPGSRGDAPGEAKQAKLLSVVDRAVTDLRGLILRGAVAPGQRLVETDLMSELAISRTTLREGFRRLETEGLLETELYRGVRVRRYTRKDMADIFEIRQELEGMTARGAALACREAAARYQVIAARTALQDSLDAPDAGQAYNRANDGFHRLLVRLSGNGVLESFMRQLHPPVLRFIYARLLDSSAREQSMREHVALIEAVLAGDAAMAERLAREHVAASHGKITALADSFFDAAEPSAGDRRPPG